MQMGMNTEEEQAFIDEFGVMVTKTRFIVPGQIYAMSGITSVAMRRTDPSRWVPIILIILGAILVLNGLSEASLLILGLVLAAAGVLWYRGLKTRFYIALHTAGGEVRALESKNEQWVNSVIEALNQAIVARG